ncbi:MAG: hypothetical protein AAGI34_13735 [Pseudomonadota bacterium]
MTATETLEQPEPAALRSLALPARIAGQAPERAPTWGQITMVPVASLAVDPAYQREVSRQGWRGTRRWSLVWRRSIWCWPTSPSTN